ncbi:peptidyl-prolyl cis-trans isomerase [Erythrobacter crassostreae]|uniref:peptidylprolyl isomerase n=1 Tax=Erythrobacter crassostreae TaxID=2828328 RepID=A0A9X1F3Q6_9SPHN|nr:peptidylprolyl isomerase [Erythrobacter crassostrea]MBV7258260.1 peptidyl-prolyl cis-trans isomerase [Erythrobacter crassostrea]
MTMPRWTREPLVHFLIAGALVYAFFAWTGGTAVDPSSRVIDVDRNAQAELALQFERTMGRSPTDAELDAQIEQYVRDEVLYREALRLGLDQDDAIVRRRLVSKMDMAAGAAAEMAEPDDATLQAFLDDNKERYQTALNSSFDQLYFTDKTAAEAALGRVLGSDGWQGIGEAISLPPTMKSASQRDIRAQFGEEFSGVLAALETGEDWRGPLRSGFGWHIVRLRERSAGETGFDALRQQLSNDWRSAQVAERKERAFDLLRDAYRIEIDR